MRRTSKIASIALAVVAMVAPLIASGNADAVTPHLIPISSVHVVYRTVQPDVMRPFVTDVHFRQPEVVITKDNDDSESVSVQWGFDYSPATNNLRAIGVLISSNPSAHVQADPIRLGDRNGPLADTTVTGIGSLTAETAANIQCHPAGTYISRLYFSIRWSDGTLTPGLSTIQWEQPASAICV